MNEPLTFAVIGDSAASGVGDSNSVGTYFGWGYHLAQAFKEPLVYINASRPGAQSKEVLHDQLPKILVHEPELVAVIVGGNDLLRNGFSPTIFEENLNETWAELEIGNVRFSTSNNRSRKDSIKWMLKNGTPWFLKRSLDLLPALLFLSATELIHIARHGLDSEGAQIFFPTFEPHQKINNHLEIERVS